MHRHVTGRSTVHRIGALAILTLAASLTSGCATKLDANATCQDFLKATISQQDDAVSSVAADVHAQNAVTPLGRPNVNYLCAGNPKMTLGEAVRRTG